MDSMNNKKYQIFISSTYDDLIDERQKVIDSILAMYNFPVGMEMFSAANISQWEIIKHTIDSSDFYVLILAKRYGSVIKTGPDAGISYTEKEYRYAKSQNIPILVFIKNDSAITVDKIDTDSENLKKLQKLEDEITSNQEVEWFSNINELATEVTRALYKAIDMNDRPGWVRGDKIPEDSKISESSVTSAIKKHIPKFQMKILGYNGNYAKVRFQVKNVSSVIVSNLKVASVQFVDKDSNIIGQSTNNQFEKKSLISGEETILNTDTDDMAKRDGAFGKPTYHKNLQLVVHFSCEDEDNNTFNYCASLHIDTTEKFTDEIFEVKAED